jgi:hypothetical protein
MLILARYSVGRVVLHLMAMAGDGAFGFHMAGILRECRTQDAVATARRRFGG